MGKIEDAIVWMSKAIEMRPNWPLYYCNRVKQYVRLGKKDLVIILIYRQLKILKEMVSFISFVKDLFLLSKVISIRRSLSSIMTC